MLMCAGAASQIIALAGCQPRETATGPSASQPLDRRSDNASPQIGAALGMGRPPRWPFWPTKMRIHPLTRLVLQPAGPAPGATDQWIVEVRIEFTDDQGQPSKEVGQLLLQWHENPAASQERVKSWNADLRDLTANRDHYDDVTRTYLFRLSVAPDEISDDSQVRAMFVALDGQQFQDRLTVKR